MSNMSHCRFENTSRDLDDCYEELAINGTDELNEYETRARKHLIETCVNIALEFGDFVNHEVEEVE